MAALPELDLALISMFIAEQLKNHFVIDTRIMTYELGYAEPRTL